jgi:hypothetical protein
VNSDLTPAQWKVKGEKDYKNKAYLDAEHAFQLAAEGFKLAEDELAAAEMENNRSVSLLQAGKPEMALQAVADTPDVFKKSGRPPASGNGFRKSSSSFGCIGKV